MSETDVRTVEVDEESAPGPAEVDGAAQVDGAAVAESEQVVADPEADRPALERRLGWGPFVAAGMAIVILAAAAGYLLVAPGPLGGDPKPVGVIGQQARWEVTAYSIGGRHPKQAHPPPPAPVRAQLGTLVRSFHDAVFLFPHRVDQAAGRFFGPPAARAITNTNFGLPPGAHDVRTLHRSARIGVYADEPRFAAARVLVVAAGSADSGPFRTALDARLWLERRVQGWNVIGYEFKQGPVGPQWRAAMHLPAARTRPSLGPEPPAGRPTPGGSAAPTGPGSPAGNAPTQPARPQETIAP